MALSAGGLKLKGNAKKAAAELEEQCPSIVFTSGLRDLHDQARAMASNVAKQPDWIAKTYKANKASKACQDWVDENPDLPRKEIAEGLYDVLSGLGSAAGQISKHLTGDAFDIQPNSAEIATVKEVIKKYKGRFLDHEGRLCRWHAQF